jgi:hypothetical protein
MTQNDFIIDSDTAYEVRLDIQNAFQALASNSSGTGQPSTRYAGMWWYETDSNIMKFRNEANSAWIDSFYIDDGAGAFRIINDTQVVNKTTGAQTGLLGDQTNATWEAGTGTTESLVSPAKIKNAILALAPESGIGLNEVWQAFGTFNLNTAYQNTYGKPIQLAVTARTGTDLGGAYSSTATFQTSTDNSTYFSVASASSIVQGENVTISQTMTLTPIIPTGHWFKLTTSGLASTVSLTVLR